MKITANWKTLNVRRPLQQRNRDRFNAVFDQVKLLLEKLEPLMISIDVIATKLRTGCARPVSPSLSLVPSIAPIACEFPLSERFN